MTLTDTIKALLESRRAEALEEAYPGEGSQKESEPSSQGSSQKAKFEVVNRGTGGGDGAKRLAPGAGAKEAKPMKQGSSKDATWEDIGSEDDGVKVSAKASETTKKPLGKGAGATPNFKTKADPTSEINKSSSKGNVSRESVEALFVGQDLSEDFKNKVAELFEALVSARVSELREEIEAEVAETAVTSILESEGELTEQVDKYLDYMAEQWIAENEVAVENTLKVQLAESFFEGLRGVFAEHYVTLPEGGTDVVEALQAEIENLKSQLDEQISAVVEQAEESIALRKDAAITEGAKGLALTEAQKLKSLCADVVFEDEDSFMPKVAVIRESYFTKPLKAPLKESIEEGTLVEDVNKTVTPVLDSEMARYTAAITHHASTL